MFKTLRKMLPGQRREQAPQPIESGASKQREILVKVHGGAAGSAVSAHVASSVKVPGGAAGSVGGAAGGVVCTLVELV